MIKLAFYKAKYGSLYDRLIAWWTRPNFWNPFKTGQYSHVEIIFSNGECYSSSPRDGGCRWKRIEGIETNGRWDIAIVSECAFFEKSLISQCNRFAGQKYDWLCIFFTNLIPAKTQMPRRWTCSEFIARWVFYLQRASEWTPNKIAKDLCKL
jgi:hypothetical protein